MVHALRPSGPLDFARGDRTMHDSQCTMIRAGSPSVMLSGGAASPAVETSRPIGTFTHHKPHTQCAASEGRNVRVQSFARGGCGLPAQSAESTGCHLERSDSGVERSRHSGTFTGAVQKRFTLIRSSGSLDKLGMTCKGASFRGLFFCHVERRAAGPQSRHPDVPELLPSRFARVHACSTLGTPRLRSG